MGEVVIREVRPEEVEAIAEIAAAAWEPIYEHYRRTMGEEMFAGLHANWRERKAAQVRSASKAGSGTFVRVAEADGRIVGFVTFDVKETTRVGEIGNNAVHPEFQGQGIAQRMYAQAFDEMKRLGMRFVKVTTGGDAAHAPARRAYEKAGFDVQLPSVTYYRTL
jgi:ribosomal protein S18 acetylase RimI-like enzyme